MYKVEIYLKANCDFKIWNWLPLVPLFVTPTLSFVLNFKLSRDLVGVAISKTIGADLK